MKRLLLNLAILLAPMAVWAQAIKTDSVVATAKDSIVAVAVDSIAADTITAETDRLPDFPGGDEALTQLSVFSS